MYLETHSCLGEEQNQGASLCRGQCSAALPVRKHDFRGRVQGRKTEGDKLPQSWFTWKSACFALEETQ